MSVVAVACTVGVVGIVAANSDAMHKAGHRVPGPGSSTGSPVILYTGDLDQGIDHFGLEPTTLLRATDWRGLYAQSGGYEIRAAQVDVATRLTDATNDTVFTITADPPDPIVLFSGISAIRPGLVTYSSHHQVSLSVGVDAKTHDEIRMTLGPRLYRLRLTAGDPQLCDAVVTLHHEGRVREMYGPGSGGLCDEPHFWLEWAGDLDGDGRLDLLVTFSGKYSAHPRQLFLSGPSDDGLPVLVATYHPY